MAEEVERLRGELTAKEGEMREARQAEQEFAAEIECQEQLFGKERQQLKVGVGGRMATGLRLGGSSAEAKSSLAIDGFAQCRIELQGRSMPCLHSSDAWTAVHVAREMCIDVKL